MNNTNFTILVSSIFLIFILWLFYTRFKGAEYGTTTRKRAKRMIEFANIKRKDIVYDLGSGFGGLAILASKKAKKTIGIEFDYLRYLISKLRILIFNRKNVKFIRGDFFKLDWNNANIIFLFLKQKTNQKLKQKLKKLKKGTRIITNRWTFDNWKPIRQDKKLKVYVYIIGKSNRD